MARMNRWFLCVPFQTPTEKFTHRIEPRNIKSLTVSNSNGEIYTKPAF